MANVEMLGETGSQTVESLVNDFLARVPSSSSGEWDWNAFASGLIGLVGQVGSSAIDTLLRKPMDAETRAAMLAEIKKLQDSGQIPKTNYTPWIIGGSVVAGLLVLALVLKR